MKRLIFVLMVLALGAFATAAMAGDYHSGLTLACAECHIAHGSQAHPYTTGGIYTPIGTAAPYEDLLRNEPNELCLTCHNGQSFAPDVFGDNVIAGGTAATNRQAGALNALAGHISNDAGYAEMDGHTLWSPALPPGGTGTAYVPPAAGLECVTCHAQHGSTVTYRNLLSRGIFAGDTIKYAISSSTPDLTKDVWEKVPNGYHEADIEFCEPNTQNSMYGQWCQNCHVDFHGAGGATNMGGASGGAGATNANPWKRHPVADVNIGQSGPTHISSLARYAGVTNKVKVMDSQGLWTGLGTNTTVTPSCMSCHKGHGNKNAFGLIFMKGTGAVFEEGDGGVYKDLCRQCHVQGA